jgi:hypothetical protein
MTIRTTRTAVTFIAPFRLKGVGETLPPGRYEVETDEEAVEGQGHTAFRRVATLLYVPTASGMRMCTVDGDELARAVAADAG